MIDPRAAIIGRRLSQARRILLLASGKGGVGKTTCAALSALLCARGGLATGLLDLDFQGASCHTLLGSSPGLPEEAGGILPAELDFGLKMVSIASFTGERAVPLRGGGVSSALIELLSVTIWGALDVLFVDMPPGTGDTLLDVIRLLPRSEVVAVSTQSRMAAAVVSRLLGLLEERRVRIAGLLLNMVRPGSGGSGEQALGLHGAITARIPFDSGLEDSLGRPAALLETSTARAIAAALARMGFFFAQGDRS